MGFVARSIFVTLVFCLGLSAQVFALPALQLDISDGVYDPITETIVATDSAFTLYALVNTEDSRIDGAGDFYLSAAILPAVDSAGDYGSFDFDGDTIDVTADMIYGTPPVEDVAGSSDLPSHGIFPTYFTEFEFTLGDPLSYANAYNAQDSPGGFSLWDGSSDSLAYAAFDIDVSNLSPDYVVHFDLYTKEYAEVFGFTYFTGEYVVTGIDLFAPFSHDAQSTPVPEPSTLLLLGSGVIGLALYRRKKK